jgi:hypothetical protein
LRVEDLLNSNWCTIQGALVDDGESTLTDLLAKFHVGVLNLTHSWYWRESTSANRNFRSTGSALRKVLFFNFKFEPLNFIHQACLLFLLLSQVVFELPHFLILSRCSHGSLHLLRSLHRARAPKVAPVAATSTGKRVTSLTSL